MKIVIEDPEGAGKITWELPEAPTKIVPQLGRAVTTDPAVSQLFISLCRGIFAAKMAEGPTGTGNGPAMAVLKSKLAEAEAEVGVIVIKAFGNRR